MEQTSAKTFTNRLFYAILLWQCNKNLKKVRTLFLYIKRKTGLSVINVFCFETRKGKGGRMNQKQTKAAVEAMLFAAGDPVSADKLAAAVQLPQTAVETALEDLRARYAREDSGLCLLHLDTRWQLATKTEWADCVRRLLDARRSVPLGPAAMETLTVIAYNQPVSRAFIEQVRGVDSSSSVSSLLQKGLIEEAGRLDLPGHPVSFRTTDVFLRCFGLSSLADLPPVRGQNEGAEGEAVR